LITGLLGSDYRAGQMTYDLRRLRLASLIHRLPRSNRYTLNGDGIRIAQLAAPGHSGKQIAAQLVIFGTHRRQRPARGLQQAHRLLPTTGAAPPYR
jgi:hypothetical protein